MEVQHENNKSGGRFYIGPANKPEGSLIYNLKGDDLMDIEHTEVDPAAQGKDYGLPLVQTAVNYARKQQMKIIPSCSFAAAMFKKHEDEWADVWSK